VAGGGKQTPFELAHGGTPAFDYFGKNRRLSLLFDRAMAQQSLLVIKKLVEHARVFDGVKVLVDVGGGTGETLALIRDRYKHIRGINMDLAHVVSEAPSLEGIKIQRRVYLTENKSPEIVRWLRVVNAWDGDVLMFFLKKTKFTGVEHVAGDMFESVPSGDAILMKVSLNIGY
jgi:caffeic acid 3-O-methyltransferase